MIFACICMALADHIFQTFIVIQLAVMLAQGFDLRVKRIAHVDPGIHAFFGSDVNAVHFPDLTFFRPQEFHLARWKDRVDGGQRGCEAADARIPLGIVPAAVAIDQRAPVRVFLDALQQQGGDG